MDRYRAGMLARSLAGHDAGQVFVITEADGAYVYLSDGRTRTADRPKKKKKNAQIFYFQYRMPCVAVVSLVRLCHSKGRA